MTGDDDGYAPAERNTTMTDEDKTLLILYEPWSRIIDNLTGMRQDDDGHDDENVGILGDKRLVEVPPEVWESLESQELVRIQNHAGIAFMSPTIAGYKRYQKLKGSRT